MLKYASGVYTGTAVTLLSVSLVFVLVNLAAIPASSLMDRFWPRTNAVQERHGDTVNAEVYPGWSEADINALLRETWQRDVTFEPYTMFREPASRGRFVNVHAAGFRESRNQGPWPPSADSFNVFLFGGSTAFAYGLPDHQTPASYLQQELAGRMARDVKIYNFGAGGFQSTQERVLFQELLAKGYRPDLAIFLDGLNEFAFPHVPMGTDQLRRMLDDEPVRRLAWLGSAVVARLPVVSLAASLHARLGGAAQADETAPVADDPAVRDLVDSVATRYLSNVRQIEAVADAVGTRAIFVWQPVPFYKFDEAYHPYVSNDNRYVAIGYASFREALPANVTANFVWCADMQQHEHKRLYVDAVHYTAEMSEKLAAEVVKEMEARRLLPDRATD